MTRDEFCIRFVTQMMKVLPQHGGTEEDLRAYAKMTAPTYYDEEWLREDGPEDCAEADIFYWEE